MIRLTLHMIKKKFAIFSFKEEVARGKANSFVPCILHIGTQ